jgi:tetratricopeptide (TPR) repeat protein
MIWKNTIVAFCCCFLLSSCSAYRQIFPIDQEPPVADSETDLGCAYFYFLWGSHAEFTGRYLEALEAYEKALICDPHVNYLEEKIPILLLKMGEFEKATNWFQQDLLDHPEKTNSRLFLANLYIQQDKIAEAIKLYYQILDQDADNESVYLRLGLLYSHQEEYAKAEKLFRQLLARNSNSYFGRLSLARLLKQTDKFQEAVLEYESALKINWSKELAYELGQYYNSHKKHEEALRLYKDISETDPFEERAALSQVQVLLDMGKNDEALEKLTNILVFSRNPANIELIISKVLLRKEEVEKAKEILLRLVGSTEDSEPRYMLGLLAFKDQDYPAALTHMEQIPSTSADFEDAVYLQTRILKETGETDKAIALLKKHIAQETTRRPFFYGLLGALYHEQKEIPVALAFLEAGISLYPDNAQLFFEYGLMLDKNGMEEQAMANMMKVLEIQPDHADALNFVGYSWADKNIRLKEALQYIEKAVALKPDNGYIVDSLGWVYYRLGDFRRAVKELERSLELEPGDPHIHDHLGDAYRALGDASRALVHYKKALEMFADEKKRSHVQEKINAIDTQ